MPVPDPYEGLDEIPAEIWKQAEKHFRIGSVKQSKVAMASPDEHVGGEDGDPIRPSKTFRGQLTGYVYTSRNGVTGYFSDFRTTSGPNNKFTVFLDNHIPQRPQKWSPTEDYSDTRHPPTSKKRRCKRARHPSGKQKRPKRRSPATGPRAEDEAADLNEHSELANEEWKKKGWWAIDTWNTNCWASALTNTLNKSSADAYLGQELKVEADKVTATVEDASMKAGWRASATPAWTTAKGRASGGMAVGVRKGYGLSPHSDMIKKALRHRIHFCKASIIFRGGINLGSIWLRDSEGLTEANLNILAEAAVAIGQLKGPWIIGGDWNITPALLQSTKWLDIVKGAIVAVKAATCNGATYDYFVVAKQLLSSIRGAQRLDDAGVTPHWPSRLLIEGNARRTKTRLLKRPPKVPSPLPAGPLPKPDDNIFGDFNVTEQWSQEIVDASTQKWYNAARKEWSSLTECGDHQPETRFVWKPLAGPLALKHAGETWRSNSWRTLANRFQEAFGRVTKHKSFDDKIACNHIRKCCNFIKHNALGKDYGNTMMFWMRMAILAILQLDEFAAEFLVKAARTAAEKIEAKTARQRDKKWRCWLAGSPEDEDKSTPLSHEKASADPACSTCGLSGEAVADSYREAKRPSRNTFRWIKHSAGWTKTDKNSIKAQDDTLDMHDPQDFIDTPGCDIVGLSQRWAPDLDNQNTVPMHDQTDIENEANQWAELWTEGAPYLCDFGEEELGSLPDVSHQQIRAAAMTFPEHTGLGTENTSPRAFARLSDSTLEQLAELYKRCEKAGRWGKIISLILIVLLGKPDGGRRPIGLFPSLVRIWMRARREVTQQWELANHRPEIFGGKNMSAMRAAWQCSFEAERASSNMDTYAQSLLDLVKAYEKVPHHIVLAAAKRLGYNLVLLRLSFAAYRFARTVGVDGIYSRLVVAVLSLTAGSGTATTELRILFVEIITDTNARWPTAQLSLYVDDLTIESSGNAHEFTVVVTGATDYIIEYLQKDRLLEVSKKKSVVVGSKVSVARGICRASKTGKLSQVKQAKLLGTPSGGGKRRATKAVSDRLPKVKKAVGKYRALRRAGINAAQAARTQATPAVSYGVAICGASDHALKNMSNAVAQLVAPDGAGRNLQILLWALDDSSGTLDVAFDAIGLPIFFWAMAWWQKWRSRRTLEDAAWKIMTQHSAPEPSSKHPNSSRLVPTVVTAAANGGEATKNFEWRKVRGPLGALAGSLRRIGWTWVAPDSVKTETGQTFIFDQDSPAYILFLAKGAIRRWIWEKISSCFTALRTGPPDIDTRGPGQQAQTSGYKDIVFNFSNILSNFLKPKAKPKQYPDWRPKFRPYLLSAVAGGQWPQARIKATRCLSDEDQCQLCQQEVGTLEHRHHCPANTPYGGWALPKPDIVKFTDKLDPNRKMLLKTRGLLSLSVRIPTKSDPECFFWVIPPKGDLPDDAKFYIDGSAMNTNYKGLESFGYGIVITDTAGGLLAVGNGRLSMSRTPLGPKLGPWSEHSACAPENRTSPQTAWGLCTCSTRDPGSRATPSRPSPASGIAFSRSSTGAKTLKPATIECGGCQHTRPSTTSGITATRTEYQ